MEAWVEVFHLCQSQQYASHFCRKSRSPKGLRPRTTRHAGFFVSHTKKPAKEKSPPPRHTPLGSGSPQRRLQAFGDASSNKYLDGSFPLHPPWRRNRATLMNVVVPSCRLEDVRCGVRERSVKRRHLFDEAFSEEGEEPACVASTRSTPQKVFYSDAFSSHFFSKSGKRCCCGWQRNRHVSFRQSFLRKVGMMFSVCDKEPSMNAEELRKKPISAILL